MTEGVFWDQPSKTHKVRVELDPDEAENVAYALGLHDVGAQDLLRWTAEARQRQEDYDDSR